MTREEGHDLACAVRSGLPGRMMIRLKSIHVAPKLHSGHLTIRIFMVPQTAEDPEPFVFAADEL